MKFAKMPISTLISTTLIAALIWFVAEGQTLSERVLEPGLALAGTEEGEGALIVRPTGGSEWTGAISLHLEGSTSRVDELLDAVASGVVLTVGRELPSQPGIYTVNLREVIRKLPAFRGSGVTITSVIPERIEIEIDRLESVTLGLRPEIDADLDTPVVLDPESIMLTGPSSLVRLWMEREDTTIPVRIGSDRLSGIEPGITHQVTALQIELPPVLRGKWATRLTPAQATASVRLRSRTASFTMREMPVRVLLPPEAFGRWIVELPAETATLKDVIFSGPQASVERIETGAAVPGAVVELSMEELERGVGSKPARIIDLPPGVTYQVGSSIVSINVRLLAGIDPNAKAPVTPENPNDQAEPVLDPQSEGGQGEVGAAGPPTESTSGDGGGGSPALLDTTESPAGQPGG